MRRALPKFLRGWRETEGAAMIEFALILSCLLFLLLGAMEFGMAWYTKYAIVGGAREGARYGVTYQTRSDGSRMPPAEFNPSIQTVANNYLANLLPSGSYQVEVISNAGYQTGQTGQDLTVTVTAQNTMDFLGGFIPKMKDMKFSGQITMKCE